MNGPFSGSRLANLREKRPSQNENPFPQSIVFLTQSNSKNPWHYSYNKNLHTNPQWTSWLVELPPGSSRAESNEPLEPISLTYKNQQLTQSSIKKITIVNENPHSGSATMKRATLNSSSMIRPSSIRKKGKSMSLLNSQYKNVFSSKKSNKKSRPKSNHKSSHKSSKKSSQWLTTENILQIK